MSSTSGSPLKRNETTGSVPNGDDPDSTAQPSLTEATIWTPFGRSLTSPAKTYKPVTFSPTSSASQQSIVAPVKSSSSPPASVSQNTTTTKIDEANGDELKISNDDKRIENNQSKETPEITDVSSLLVPSSANDDNQPRVASTVFKFKTPSQMSASAVIWKPPSSPDLRSTSPDPSRADRKVSTPTAGRRNLVAGRNLYTGKHPEKLSTAPISTKNASSSSGFNNTEAPSVPSCEVPASSRDKGSATLASLEPGSPTAERVTSLDFSERSTKGSSVSLPVDLIDLSGGEDHCPVGSTVRRGETRDTSRPTVFDRNIAERDEDTSATVLEAAPFSNTKAGPHLWRPNIEGAGQSANGTNQKSDSGQQVTTLSNDIIQEWRSGFCNDINSGDRTKEAECESAKGHFKVRHHDPVYPDVSAVDPPIKRTASEEDQSGMKDGPLDFAAPDSGSVPVKFDGIRSTDETTVVSADEQNRKDLHQNGDENRRSTPPASDQPSPLPRYDPQPYRHKPRRIEDYEPGRHSSLAPQAQELDHRKIFESDAEVDYRSGDIDSVATRGEDGDQDDNKTKGPRKKEVLARSVRSNSIDRTQNDEKSQRRRQEIDAVIARERHRRFVKEQKLNETRRHKDVYTLSEKRSVLLDRFSNLEARGPSFTRRPKQISAMERRGKARALYPFQAQNNAELSFDKGDVICLLRKIDRNWYQGERNGAVGIIPVAYLEVITALEEADTLPLHREGKAIAKFDFRPKTSDELELHRGDSVTLIRKVDQNWYEGRVGNRKGLFPVSFVETIQGPDPMLVQPSPVLATSSIPDAEVPVNPVSTWNSKQYNKEFERELKREISKCQVRLQNGSNSKSLVINGKQASSCETLWKPKSSYSTLPTVTTSSQEKDLIDFDDNEQTANTENFPTTVASISSVESTGDGSNLRKPEPSVENLGFDLENERPKLSKEDSSAFSRKNIDFNYRKLSSCYTSND